MAPVIPNGEPQVVTAGDTWQWYAFFRDYAPTEGGGTWTLAYAIVGGSKLEWDPSWASAGSGQWTVTIPASATADLPPGRYAWTAILTGGGTLAGQRATPAQGHFTVYANPASLAPGDTVTVAEKNLAAVEAVLSGRITADVQSWAIAGRSVVAIPVSELYLLRNQFRAEVLRERNAGKALPGVSIAFRQPGHSPT